MGVNERAQPGLCTAVTCIATKCTAARCIAARCTAAKPGLDRLGADSPDTTWCAKHTAAKRGGPDRFAESADSDCGGETTVHEQPALIEPPGIINTIASRTDAAATVGIDAATTSGIDAAATVGIDAAATVGIDAATTSGIDAAASGQPSYTTASFDPRQPAGAIRVPFSYTARLLNEPLHIVVNR
jgi:hypothetical protein